MREERDRSMERFFVGMSAQLSKTISDADIEGFATASGDRNPIHMDDDFARTTRFKGRIVHGMLTASLISSAIANKLPGPGSIYLGQTLRFIAPVRPGDHVEANVVISHVDCDKRTLTLNSSCSVAGSVVLEGESLVKV
jgi:acyl dehydratase